MLLKPESPNQRPGSLIENIQDLKEEVGPKMKEGLKGAVDALKNLLASINPFRTGLEKAKGVEKMDAKALVTTLAPLFFYFMGFQPEKKKEFKEKNESAEEETKAEEIPKTKKEVCEDFMDRTSKKESTSSREDKPFLENGDIKPYFLYVNFDADEDIGATYDMDSKELFKKGLPSTFEGFKKFLAYENVPPVTINALSKSALGKYQIIPKFHFERLGWNPKSLEDIYLFLKEPDRQERLMENMTDEYYEITGGDTFLMAVCHYAGIPFAKKVKENPNAPEVVAKLETMQGQGKYPSILKYASHVSGNTQTTGKAKG